MLPYPYVFLSYHVTLVSPLIASLFHRIVSLFHLIIRTLRYLNGYPTLPIVIIINNK